MINIKTDKELLWDEIEKIFPGIKDEFESCAIALRLMKNPDACTKINFGLTSKSGRKDRIPLIRCHIYENAFCKIFSFYYNTKTNEMFARNEIRHGMLNCNSEKISINSFDELRKLLQKLVLK